MTHTTHTIAENDWGWHAPLEGSLDAAIFPPSRPTLEPIGAHRFVECAGRTGWMAGQRDAALKFDYRPWMNASKGTISVWVSPLEDIRPWTSLAGGGGDGSNAGGYKFPLVCDVWPTQRLPGSVLGLHVAADWHPGMMAKCMYGLDRQYAPRRAHIHTDEMPMRRGHWYHMAIGWDIEQRRLDMYVNGERLNASQGLHFDEVGEALYFGNPMMVFSDLRVADRLLEPPDLSRTFQADLAADWRPIDSETKHILHGRPATPLVIDMGGYERQTSMALTHQDEVDRFVRQGPDNMPLHAWEATREGMLFETAASLDMTNLCYLWGPDRYEGDLLLRYEFRQEADRGLALVIFNASTLARQDIIDQRDYPATGSMATIIRRIRNYWWEYVRRTPPVRKHVASHVLVKGPYARPLSVNVADTPVQGQWHQLTVSKEGARIRCALDDRCLIDVMDDPTGGFGNSYDFGRIGLRHMQQTRMRYRNLEVFTRPVT